MLSRAATRVARRPVPVKQYLNSKHVSAVAHPFSTQLTTLRRPSVFTSFNASAIFTRSLSQLVHQVQREVGTPKDLNIESLPLKPAQSEDAAPNPLRILFCGSDELSATVLRALHAEHLSNPSLIESISVFHRPGKATGRGLKKRTIPILKTVAEELQIPDFHVHERDTFTGWSPPIKPEINLIVAVSFGLFVPPRILNGAKYRGLNIHPSLLPDLRGCSPIQSAILHQDKETGITLQDLNPKVFDHGKVLARLRWTIENPEEVTNEELTRELAGPASQLLIYGLRNGLFQHERVQELPEPELDHPPREAKKMRKEDMQLIPSMDAAKTSAVKRALGQVWVVRKLGEDKKASEVRILLDDLSVVPLSPAFSLFLETKGNEQGLFRPLKMTQLLSEGTQKGWSRPMMKSEDGKSVELYLGGEHVLKVGTATVSGGKKTTAVKALWGKEIDDGNDGKGGSHSWLADALTFGIMAAVIN